MDICELTKEPDVVREDDEPEEITPLSFHVIFLPIIIIIIASVIVVNTSLFASHPEETIIPVPTQEPQSESPYQTNATMMYNASVSNNVSYIGWTWINTTYVYNSSYYNTTYYSNTTTYWIK